VLIERERGGGEWEEDRLTSKAAQVHKRHDIPEGNRTKSFLSLFAVASKDLIIPLLLLEHRIVCAGRSEDPKDSTEGNNKSFLARFAWGVGC
jgi:hypothetical protein